MLWRGVDPSELLKQTSATALLEDADAGHCYLSFRAGTLSRVGGRLTSDKRKGQVVLVQSEEPGFVNVQWYPRDVDASSGTSAVHSTPEIDQMVFEGEAQVSWVGPQKNRVLRVVFSEEPDRNMFYWLQEPDNSSDDLIVMRFGDCLNKTSASGAWQSKAASQPVVKSSDQVVAEALAQYLAAAAQQQSGPAFEDILTPNIVEGIMTQAGIPNRLIEFLPEGMQTQEELVALARAPPFWQQVRALSSAVQRGTIDSRQFGFAASEPGVLGFLKALQAYVDSDRQEQKGMWKLIGQGDPGAARDGKDGDQMDES
eukprot:jgi/Ulvmu1/2993/UM015_0033.1